ncbi:MAG: UvrB/UvrC motif-containing protein [Candidatus Zixiibacteriota bacterium]
MKCENCGEREASVHFTQIRDNRKTEMHLCKECAKSKGFHNPLDDVPFPLAEFLTSMVQRGSTPSDPIARLVCPECGMRFLDFSRIGRFGCGHCYTAFRAPLEDLFRKVHGATRHRGRNPDTRETTRQSPVEEEVRVKEDLKRAIEREDFELAAELRDRLKALTAESPQPHEQPGE